MPGGASEEKDPSGSPGFAEDGALLAPRDGSGESGGPRLRPLPTTRPDTPSRFVNAFF